LVLLYNAETCLPEFSEILPKRLTNKNFCGCPCTPSSYTIAQWRTQNIFMEVFPLVAYGGHLYLMCAICDVTIWRHSHVSKPTFWRSLLA